MRHPSTKARFARRFSIVRERLAEQIARRPSSGMETAISGTALDRHPCSGFVVGSLPDQVPEVLGPTHV